MSNIGIPLQRFPGKQEKEAAPQPHRAEAIALRRIIVERGTWLSPFMGKEPMPKLTPAEADCDLVKLAVQQMTDRHIAPRHAVLDRVDAPTKKEVEKKKSHKAKPKPLPTLEEIQAAERQEGRDRYEKKKLQKNMSQSELRSALQGGKKKKKTGEQSRMTNPHK